jgi:hypothetical protein
MSLLALPVQSRLIELANLYKWSEEELKAVRALVNMSQEHGHTEGTRVGERVMLDSLRERFNKEASALEALILE